jgi:hypothetical protein
MKLVRRIVGLGLLITLVIAASPIGAATAQAATIAYSMSICEDLSVLQHPSNAIVAQNAALKSQFVLMNERTLPYIELKNTSDNAFLTQFTMSIGDTSKNFDWGKLVEASPGVTFTIQSPDSIAGGIKSDLLSIHFTGFAPGDFVRLRVGLSPDSASANPIMDYRNVFFNMNGSNPSNNSVVNLSFASSDVTKLMSKQLPDFPNANPFTSTNLNVLTTTCGMDSVMPFTISDQSSITPPVPEPASAVLLGMGSIGVLALGLWRRRQAR